MESARLVNPSGQKRPIPRSYAASSSREAEKENEPPPIEPEIVLTPVPTKTARKDVLLSNFNLQEPNCFQALIEVQHFFILVYIRYFIQNPPALPADDRQEYKERVARLFQELWD